MILLSHPAMASSRQLRTKIQATRNIGQITKAMEMVAASKMRRAEDRALRARPYAAAALRLLKNLLTTAREEGFASHPLARGSKEGGTCVVAVTSDKGLCGGLNAAVQRLALQTARQGERTEIVAVGRKGKEFFENAGYPIVFEMAGLPDAVRMSDIRPLASFLMGALERGTYRNVVVCSTAFVSVLHQKALATEILPLSVEALEEVVAGIIPVRGGALKAGGEREDPPVPFSVFEPSSGRIMEFLIPELVSVEVLHLLLEANASEHAARMVAMRNASDSAEDMVQRLNQRLNKARQSAITQELAEISTAKEALASE